MSDGMSDARVMEDVERELYKVAQTFREALTKAQKGHRGWGLSQRAVAETVNEVLEGSGFLLTLTGRVR